MITMVTGVSTRAFFLDVQEQVHRKVMEVDFFSAWILTHDTLPGLHTWSHTHICMYMYTHMWLFHCHILNLWY